MRSGIDSTWMTALSAAGVTTAIVARLDFQSETAFVWTGAHSFTISGSGDALLDGNTFDPLANGVVVDVGENTFSYSGSEAMTITLAIPASPSAAIASASVFPQEYQGRQATFWRALLIAPPTPGVAPVWFFRRIRSGSMDEVTIQETGDMHVFRLTVEAHAARISQASNRDYLDQKKIDPTDTSQDYAVAIANGKLAPGGSTAGSANLGGGRGGFDWMNVRPV